MPASFAIVLTTCGDETEAAKIARRLVEDRLAACVQRFPIASTYRWEGKVEEAGEFMLFCKIRAEDYPAVEAAIRAGHGYVNPEIIAIDIKAGAPAYLDWILAITNRET
ncbi:MAG: divalent-cation tolerance protein CutA [Alphaproteobacteria bacterium]|nr:divalent-cation tolerance protein CutA [Alphaproteobacteria bacterium]